MSALKRELKPIWPVHKPWQELSLDSNISWQPGPHDDYFSSAGGPLEHGPSSAVQQAARSATCPAVLFLFFIPLDFFEKVAKWSNKYAYKDWVEAKYGKDRDSNRKIITNLVPVKSSER